MFVKSFCLLNFYRHFKIVPKWARIIIFRTEFIPRGTSHHLSRLSVMFKILKMRFLKSGNEMQKRWSENFNLYFVTLFKIPRIFILLLIFIIGFLKIFFFEILKKFFFWQLFNIFVSINYVLNYSFFRTSVSSCCPS